LVRAASRRARDERGVTLIELLVGMAAAVGVFAATLVLLESSTTVQTRDAEWALVLQEDRAGLSRMARDIRQANESRRSERQRDLLPRENRRQKA